MNPAEESAVEIAEGALGLLEGDERRDAEELLALCRRLFPEPAEASRDDRARLGRLVELLARRRSQAMPYAALGRALLAHLSGESQHKTSLLGEFESKMALLGL